jgi:hypothetical protein
MSQRNAGILYLTDCTPVLITMAHRHIPKALKEQTFVIQLYQNKIGHKDKEKCRVMSSCAVESVGLNRHK